MQFASYFLKNIVGFMLVFIGIDYSYFSKIRLISSNNNGKAGYAILCP